MFNGRKTIPIGRAVAQCVPKCFNGREAQPIDRGMAPELLMYEGLRGQSPTSVIPRFWMIIKSTNRRRVKSVLQ